MRAMWWVWLRKWRIRANALYLSLSLCAFLLARWSRARAESLRLAPFSRRRGRTVQWWRRRRRRRPCTRIREYDFCVMYICFFTPSATRIGASRRERWLFPRFSGALFNGWRERVGRLVRENRWARLFSEGQVNFPFGWTNNFSQILLPLTIFSLYYVTVSVAIVDMNTGSFDYWEILTLFVWEKKNVRYSKP